MKFLFALIVVLVALLQVAACSARKSGGQTVEVYRGCAVAIPAGYKKIRESEGEIAFFSGGNRTGSIAIKRGDFSSRINNFDEVKSQYLRAERRGDYVLYYKTDNRGSVPVSISNFFGNGFGIIVTGKDAENIDALLSNCVDRTKVT